ncbi:MAG: hypothetical protein U0164_08325 [Gemmatimonadaceae bacterium]
MYDSYAPVDEQPVRAGAAEPEIDLLDELTPPFMRHSAEEDASAALESARVHDAAEESTSIAGQVEVPASADVDREDVAADATAEYARGARGGEPEDERDREGAEHAAIASDGVDRLPEGSGAPDEDHPAVQDERGSDELLTGERASALDIEALRALVDVRQERDARAGEGELEGVDGALVEGAFQEPPVDLPLLDVTADADPLAIGQELDLGVSEYAVDDLLSQPPSFESVDSTEFVPDPELARELLSEGTRARGESTEDSRSDEARDPAGVSGNTEEWPADAAPEVLIDGEWRDEHMGDLVSGEVSAIVVPGTERPNRAGPRFDDLSAALMWPEPVGEDGDRRSVAAPRGVPKRSLRACTRRAARCRLGEWKHSCAAGWSSIRATSGSGGSWARRCWTRAIARKGSSSSTSPCADTNRSVTSMVRAPSPISSCA